MLEVSQGGRACPALNTVLKPFPTCQQVPSLHGCPRARAMVGVIWGGCLGHGNLLASSRIAWFCQPPGPAATLLCWGWHHDSNGHGAPKTVTLVTEEWIGGWPDCHHEDPVNQLSISGFETNGKDGFRVLGKHWASSAWAGQSLNYLSIGPPGEVLKSNIRKVDLNIHPEHQVLVLVPYLLML